MAAGMARRLGWFVLLWCAGVAAVSAVALVLHAVLLPAP